eukprot:4215920-Ditylum_brightwellii.AAC.1
MGMTQSVAVQHAAINNPPASSPFNATKAASTAAQPVPGAGPNQLSKAAPISASVATTDTFAVAPTSAVLSTNAAPVPLSSVAAKHITPALPTHPTPTKSQTKASKSASGASSRPLPSINSTPATATEKSEASGGALAMPQLSVSQLPQIADPTVIKA